MSDDEHLRVGDAERDVVVARLREAHVEGRLDLAELDERLDAALSARTRADLVPLTADLPVEPSAPVPAVRPHAGAVTARVTGQPGEGGSTVAVLGDVAKEGTWRCGSRHFALALLGDVRLDLRHAHLETREITLSVSAVLGDATVVVPAGWDVSLDVTAVLGDSSHRAATPARVDPTAPRVRVTGLSLMGDVTVVRTEPDGSVPTKKQLRQARRAARRGLDGGEPPPQLPAR